LSRDIYDEAGGFNVNDPNGEEDYSLWQRSLKLVPYGLFLTDGYIIYDNTRNVDCETNPVLSPLYRGNE
jgi:predicted ABC-type ATPase